MPRVTGPGRGIVHPCARRCAAGLASAGGPPPRFVPGRRHRPTSAAVPASPAGSCRPRAPTGARRHRGSGPEEGQSHGQFRAVGVQHVVAEVCVLRGVGRPSWPPRQPAEPLDPSVPGSGHRGGDELFEGEGQHDVELAATGQRLRPTGCRPRWPASRRRCRPAAVDRLGHAWRHPGRPAAGEPAVIVRCGDQVPAECATPGPGQRSEDPGSIPARRISAATGAVSSTGPRSRPRGARRPGRGRCPGAVHVAQEEAGLRLGGGGEVAGSPDPPPGPARPAPARPDSSPATRVRVAALMAGK